MKFKHTGLFIPQKVMPSDVSDSRKYSFVTEDMLGNKSNSMKKEAVRTSFINSYAMRNYWVLALGETCVVDASWYNIQEFKKELSELSEVDVVSERNDKTGRSIVIETDSEEDSRKVKRYVESEYSSKIPISLVHSQVEVKLRFKWLGSSDQFFFDDVIDLWD